MLRLTAPSMLDEASKTVTSGLRPKAKINKKATEFISTNYAQSQSKQPAIRSISCSNPLDKLCALLLGWQILGDVGKERSSISLCDSNYTPLPTSYENFLQYLACWEPMLVEEIKAGILSNLPLSTKRQSKCGIAMVSVQGVSLPSSILINLSCIFNENISKGDGPSTGSFRRDAPGVMDLILLSTEPIQIPLNLASVQNMIKNQQYMLVMVTSNTRPDGSRGFQIKGHQKSWIAVQTRTNQSDIIDQQKKDNKVLDLKPTQVRAQAQEQSLKKPINDRVIPKRSVLDSEMILESNKKSTGNPGKGSGTDVLSLHYIIIDGLTSSWREFLALQEMSSKVQLAQCVLTAETKGRLFELATPTGLESQNEEGLSFERGLFPNSNASTHESENVPNGDVWDFHSPLRNSKSFSKEGSQEEMDEECSLEGSDDDVPPPPPPSEHPSSSSDRNLIQDPHEKNSEKEELKQWEDLGLTFHFLNALKKSSNQSQLDAIRYSISTPGFTLIQGPPGTGKTTTIIGILNAFHIREYDRYYRLAVDVFLGPEGQRCRLSKDPAPWLKLISKVSKSKPHILAVAPSNVAVDNIIERIMSKGFTDGKGGKYYPTILRLGMGRGSTVKAVSLEDTFDEEQNLFRSVGNKTDYLRSVESELNRLIFEIHEVQSLLINLQLAFQQHPLPIGWELRVRVDTGMPYWVDHINRCTSACPPARPPPEIELGYPSLHSLPEYQIHEQKIAQLLDRLDKQNLRYTRFKALAAMRSPYMDFNTRQLLECSITDEAHIVFTTVNGSGHPSLESTEFCVTVIDEAAQCTELSALIPLKRGCRQCIMVGDQKQLCPLVFSDKAKRAGYGRSLFERLAMSGHTSHMLDTQYRMDAVICGFASSMFYENKLLNGPNIVKTDFRPSYLNGDNTKNNNYIDNGVDMNGKNDSNIEAKKLSESKSVEVQDPLKNENSSASSFLASLQLMQKNRSTSTNASTSSSSSSLSNPPPIAVKEIDIEKITMKPFLFFDLLTSKDSSGSDRQASQSLSNIEEAKTCINILETLIVQARKKNCKLGSIGVITPYSEQVLEIKRRLSNAGLLPTSTEAVGSSSIAACLDVEVNTVDSFQGREKDIIIVSCVRANDEGSIGFLSDARRMNVALTRAKYGLYVVANAETLCGNPRWCKLVEYARDNDALLTLTEAYQPIMPLLHSSYSCSFAANPKVTVDHENTNNSELSEFSCSGDLSFSHLISKRVAVGMKRNRDEDSVDDRVSSTESSSLNAQK